MGTITRILLQHIRLYIPTVSANQFAIANDAILIASLSPSTNFTNEGKKKTG